MLMLINHFAVAEYQTDGTVDLTSIPITDLVYTGNSSRSVNATAGQIVYVVRIRYHNELEYIDPYYTIIGYFSGNDFSIVAPSGSYYFIYTNDGNLNNDKCVVAVTKDLEILCSLPEPSIRNSVNNAIVMAGCSYDYDFWRINTAYMPELVPVQ